MTVVWLWCLMEESFQIGPACCDLTLVLFITEMISSFTFTTAITGVGPEVDSRLEILNESLHLPNPPRLIPEELIPTPDGLPLPGQPPSQGLDGPSLPSWGFDSVMP